jgi:NAD(P)-dependent dehydrogenase (short-subunit alcohol dehydrogenase family)
MFKVPFRMARFVLKTKNMKKTVLITGTSSGIGKATAKEFARQGWNVVATQRSPENEKELGGILNIRLEALDVTDAASVHRAFERTMSEFGRIDAVVNNAGYGVDGVFEAMTDEDIRRQYETNVFGLMRVTREAIKAMRPNRDGVIIQVSSMGGRITFPLYSIYHGTKWAVEGFSESLHYELSLFNVRVKIVEPGPIVTEFYGRSRVTVKPSDTDAYDAFIEKFDKAAEGVMKTAEGPEVVAKTIFKAATDGSGRLRYAVGKPGPLLLRMRKLLSDGIFIGMVRKTYKL